MSYVNGKVDSVAERHLPDATQPVILGAGFDTRAFRLPKDGPIRSFEVDAPKTQATKCEMLDKASIDSSRVTFVAVEQKLRVLTSLFMGRSPELSENRS